ncbi:penicillin-binding protein 1B [Aquirhabdus sp.]|uniref:penicillin-binding protein 1B n=1 Tax=Aquirhabdus sp. TaxID=2824160 RepID=UPI00396C614F
MSAPNLSKNSSQLVRRIMRHGTGMPSQNNGFVIIGLVILVVIAVVLIGLGIYVARLDSVVRTKFEGQRWEIPAKVYARPLELYVGATVDKKGIKDELELLGYKSSDSYQTSGTYTDSANTLFIHTRGFNFGTSKEPEQVLKVQFTTTSANNGIADIQSTQPNTTGVARLEPVLIGGIYPRINEDRVLIKLSETPQSLVDALIATEDRSFYQHHGVSIRGLGRALLSNATGGARQGGSTLTQQLVKNFYLTSERTLKRKATEAVMALLLESHYSKNEILETYLNEINLGQNGNRSINGFGLASQFYFGQPIQELKLNQVALLVGLVKGPSEYNPWRHPEASLARRNVVLQNMLDQGKITQEQYQAAHDMPLGIVEKPTAGQSLYPDFLDMVRRQLRLEYQETDLTSDGLQIFTTLDPRVQNAADAAFAETLNKIVKSNPKRLTGLQGAVLVGNPQNGEILAVVGGSGLFTGYNRALDARRQVGSLFKPAVYLTALASGRYNLASLVDDGPVNITGAGMSNWQPKNYDLQDHGVVSLTDALAHSYNQATVNLGMQLGVPQVVGTLKDLGINATLPTYPSVLLGAANLAPLDILNMYGTIASDGFQHPPRAIISVIKATGEPLQRYGLSMRQSVDPAPTYLLNYAMQQVVKSGTAQAANRTLSPALNLAGKTGTTNDLRDSWFAGYSGNYVSVVWVGQDDNRPTGLSGASGALPIWINLMSRLKLTPVELAQPDGVVWQWVDAASGQVSAEGCPGATYIPMLRTTLPSQISPCGQEKIDQLQQSQNNTDMYSTPVMPSNNGAQNTTAAPTASTPVTPSAPAPRTPPRQTSAIDRAMESF